MHGEIQEDLRSGKGPAMITYIKRKGAVMKYFFSKTVDTDFDTTEEMVRGLLKEQGFGVLTEIDVQATLKKKLDVDFRRYKILGACNPPYAHTALLAEDKIGLMLPCNVIIGS